MPQPAPPPRRPGCPTKCPAMPPITAPFTQPAASDGPDDKPITASIAAAATSIVFLTISFLDHALAGERPSRSPRSGQGCCPIPRSQLFNDACRCGLGKTACQVNAVGPPAFRTL